MKLLHRSLIACLPLVVACATKTTSDGSENPDAGNYDDYYSETSDGATDAGGADGGGETPGQATARGTSTANTNARARARAKALSPKKGPVTGDKKDPPKLTKRGPKPAVGEVRIDGIVPSAATPGTTVEIFGAGLDQKGFVPSIGGTPQKVVERSEDRMVVKIVGGKGPLGVGKMSRGRDRARARVVPADKTSYAFEVLKKGSVFGTRTDANHGLIGTVYAIENPVQEVPAFDSLGDPLGTIAVDNLAVGSATFDGSLMGRTEWFGIHFRGSLNVVEAGDYNLCMAAGSGALLFLDGNSVIDNDGAHATEEKCEELYIEPGEYAVDLLYYQGAAGELGLTLSWAKDGGEKTPIPAASLFPPDDRPDTLIRK